MRQDRKKFKDDDTGSVISEARSQRSMVIDGSSVRGDFVFSDIKMIQRSVSGSSRHRGKRGSKTEEHSGASAGSNFGNRPQASFIFFLKKYITPLTLQVKVTTLLATSTSLKMAVKYLDITTQSLASPRLAIFKRFVANS